MITADKVFKGSTEIIKVYRGDSLEWEKPIDVPYSWNPTTYINSENNFYAVDQSSRQTHTVTLNLPENVAAVNNHLTYNNPEASDKTNYLYSYALDSTTIKKCELTLDTGTGDSKRRQMGCTQFPGDAASHSIYFKSYSGQYYFSGYYTSIIMRPQLIYHPSKIKSTHTKYSILFDTSGIWTYYIYPDEVDTWTSDFQIQGVGTYNLKLTLISGLEDGEYPPCTFYINELDSDVAKKTLTVLYDTGGSVKTSIVSYTVTDDNPHTIKFGGHYKNWGRYTAKIEVSSITYR